MNIFQKISILLIGWGVWLSYPASAAEPASAEMDFHGSLVAQPCWIKPEYADKIVDMGNIPNADLYYNPHSRVSYVTIILTGCDFGESGQGTVTTRFEGTESTELPGYLAMSMPGTGAAIGLMTQAGANLPLGQESAPVVVKNGGNILNFTAFVQAEPSALKNHTLSLGDFTATTTFFLDYP